jgi:hypothetical protein
MKRLKSELEVLCPCCQTTLVIDRESIFQQSVDAEKTRGDALSRRFEEALKQARQEPVTKPTRDWDLD